MVDHHPGATQAQAAGWNSGTSGFTSPHNIYTDSERHESLDGKPFNTVSLIRQQAKTVCLICGEWVISFDYPTAPFRHMTPEEVARYTGD